ncbi:MAG: DNA-binding protein [Conexivisphaerales archaeon]
MAKIYLVTANKEVPKVILDIAKSEQIQTARVEMIGAVKEVEIAYYDHAKKKYESKVLKEDMEVISMLGNISMMRGEPILHIHGSFGRRDYSIVGGHVVKAVAEPFLEAIITPTQNKAYREYDENLGLNAIKRIE